MSGKFHGAACKTCRRRGRKCTRELPKCKSCLDKGIECEGYTLKWTGLASRGKLAGKTSMPKSKPTKPKTAPLAFRGQPSASRRDVADHPDNVIQVSNTSQTGLSRPVWNSPSQTPNWSPSQFDQSRFSNLTPRTMELNMMAEDSDSSPEAETSNVVARHHASLGFMTFLLDPYNVPKELKYILGYHLGEVAPRLCVDTSTTRNPYSQYILPLGIQRPALLYACAALAACHYSVRLQDQGFHIDCLRFRGKAMRRLQEQLWSEETAKDESNIAAVLMLTLTDMCLGGFSNFDAHFAAARKLIDLRGESRTQDAFVEQYIGWLDVMLAASNRRKPLFSSNEISLLRGSNTEWSYDVFPCPPDQFEIFSRVVELHKSQDDHSVLSQEVLDAVNDLKDELLYLPLHTERGAAWLHLTEAYRFAIALYMLRLFKVPVDEDDISYLAHNVFYHAKNIQASTGWADHLLWPLFHAGLEFRDAKRQEWLRIRAEEMQRSGGFRNVETIMEILERVWSTDERPDYLTLLTENGGSGSMVPV
ncbi:hypothetical protein PV10_08390 [Exophiala mesophila]|uniref:Zn(2)-C6 fungal-type domain-containing protein n=1 Tax=Exophiala mesophila TaxID=212818 RepID=A0A0D1ZPK9_EXOME|nr:uncharacterized protein PV10_08390 [Exophiala mesophila]KIV88738.1 hypothetical protein PV10_08390 [Exophiala mesophila]